MSSVFFRIEAYDGSYGCPEYGLMGYIKIEILVQDCWDYYHSEHAEDFEDDTDVGYPETATLGATNDVNHKDTAVGVGEK